MDILPLAVVLPEFAAWQWALLVFGALLVGVSKTGIPGLGILFVAVFANVFPDSLQATGIVLPLLVVGDAFAVVFYKRHWSWRWFPRLFPWAAAGVVAGYFAMGHIDKARSGVLVGAIIVVLSAVHFWRQRKTAQKATENGANAENAVNGSDAAAAETAAAIEMPIWFCPVIGLLMGFTTLVANAAGPLATLFFLAARLPKMEFVGTSAVFFMVLNWFKVPFMAHLGLINAESLKLNALLLPAVAVGAIAGVFVLRRVEQRLFENVALWLGVLAGVKLLAG